MLQPTKSKNIENIEDTALPSLERCSEIREKPTSSDIFECVFSWIMKKWNMYVLKFYENLNQKNIMTLAFLFLKKISSIPFSTDFCHPSPKFWTIWFHVITAISLTAYSHPFCHWSMLILLTLYPSIHLIRYLQLSFISTSFIRHLLSVLLILKHIPTIATYVALPVYNLNLIDIVFQRTFNPDSAAWCSLLSLLNIYILIVGLELEEYSAE